MHQTSTSRAGLWVAIVALALNLLAVGCSSHTSYRKAEIAAAGGDWDQAVLFYMEAVEQEPENLPYRSALLRAKISASQMHFDKGKRFREAGVLGRALVEFQQAVQLDPTNQYAQAELQALQAEIRAQDDEEDLETIEELKRRTAGQRAQPPEFDPRSKEPIDFNFPRPTKVRDIYTALADAYGFNVLFDPTLKDSNMTLVLEDVVAQDALEVVMRTAGHFYKVQDEHTIIVVQDTPQNRRKYEDLMVQTFFLSNADIKTVMTMLRSLVDAKKIAINEQLNAIVLRDTADKVKVAERIIQANDKAKAEVVVDVELLQVNSNKLRNLGMQLDSYSVTQSLDLGGEDVPLRLSDIDDLTTNNWVLTLPNFIYSFVKTNTDAQLLARPQLRITEGEKARLLIGERVPIPTTTFNTSNTVGGNIVPLTTFQYTDVGIQIQIEPRVHHNKEITLKVTIEVSNISGFVEGGNGQRQPLIGTRTIESTIRLRDGETNFLAGLIRTEELETESGIPGLSDIPVLGRLFSNNNRDDTRTDVILTMTPHIIRTPSITEEDLLPIWVGTEQQITFRGGSPRVESDVNGPFDADANNERIQQLLRERAQRLPQGLRTSGEAPESEEPQGIDLAPSGGPSSLFQPDEPEPPGDSADLDSTSLDSAFRRDSAFPEDSAFLDSAFPEDVYADAPAETFVLAPLGAGIPAAAARDLQPTSAALAASQTNALAASGAGVFPADGPAVRLRLTPGRLQVAPGDLFEVTLVAEAREPISHLPLELTFDPRLLAIEGAERGEFLGPEGEAVVMANETRPGHLVLGASRLGQNAPVAGNGVVARVRFRALAAGISDIGFQDAGALGAELVPLTSVRLFPARVLVDPATPTVPEGESRPDGPRPQGPRPQGAATET